LLLLLAHVVTLNDDNTVSRVTAQAVGGCALVLSRVTRLAVDDLDGDDTISVGDGELVRLKRLAGLGPGDGRVGIARAAAEQLAGAALLHHPWTEVEGEHGSALLLLLVELVGVELPLANWKRLRLIPWQVLWHWLDIEEDWLLCCAIVVLCGNDELAAVLNPTSVDDKGVVVTNVALHVLHALLQLGVVVVPSDRAVGERDDSASEPCALTLQGEGGLWFDHKPWSSTLAVDKNLLHPVLLHLQLPEAGELRHASHGEDKVVPVGILLPDLLTDGKESVPGDLKGLVAVVASQPRMEQALMCCQTGLLLLHKQLANEVLSFL